MTLGFLKSWPWLLFSPLCMSNNSCELTTIRAGKHITYSPRSEQALHCCIPTDTDCVLVQTAATWCWCVWSGMASAAAGAYGSLSQNPPLRWAPPAHRSGPSPGCRRPRPYRATDHMETWRDRDSKVLRLFSLRVLGDLLVLKKPQYLSPNYSENVEWVSRIFVGNAVIHFHVVSI